jgi:uncharacterized protein YebE (UPF0316 family)
MINKLLLIFIFGTIETYLYTGWNLTANQRKKWVSSILMFIYMTIYLLILDAAFKDNNSKLMILDYALACALGNFLRIKHEKCKKL